MILKYIVSDFSVIGNLDPIFHVGNLDPIFDLGHHASGNYFAQSDVMASEPCYRRPIGSGP
jgi:hypothetical protein